MCIYLIFLIPAEMVGNLQLNCCHHFVISILDIIILNHLKVRQEDKKLQQDNELFDIFLVYFNNIVLPLPTRINDYKTLKILELKMYLILTIATMNRW